MTIGALRIQTPVGVVEVGDVVTVDLSNDPVAMNYGWPKQVIGKVFDAHAGCLVVALDGLRIPNHHTSPCLLLGADNADNVLKVVKA